MNARYGVKRFPTIAKPLKLCTKFIRFCVTCVCVCSFENISFFFSLYLFTIVTRPVHYWRECRTNEIYKKKQLMNEKKKRSYKAKQFARDQRIKYCSICAPCSLHNHTLLHSQTQIQIQKKKTYYVVLSQNYKCTLYTTRK